MDLNKLDKEKKIADIKLDDKENKLVDFLSSRIEVLKRTKTDIGGGLNFEELMRAADKEYLPNDLTHKLGVDDKHNLVLMQDDTLGLRGTSRVISLDSLSQDSWRSTLSEPTLLVKIQTALSILIDQNPEAVFKATNEKYEKRNNVAKALWKRSWEINNGIDVLKLFVFDLAKYGFAVGHTVPRILKRDKEILISIDTDKPENNKYKKIKLVEFNDVYREKLDLYRTWIDDKANLTDPFSINDWYYEKDYTADKFEEEFGMYKNSKAVKCGTPKQENNDGEGQMNSATKTRDDIITVGFYENKEKDLFCIFIPDQNIPVYYSPLPNDDGKLTLWYASWIERDPRTIYGIGLYELLKNSKVMYDRMKNMNVDQITMATYPMLFMSGTPKDGQSEIILSPNTIQQKNPGTTVEQVKIQYDNRGWEAIGMIKEEIDDTTGITPTLQGEVEGKTLGETLHAKDSALKRLNIPMLNIAKAIEMDAYITLSWANQVYSTPEIQEFTDAKDMQEYEDEYGVKADSFESEGVDEQGTPIGQIKNAQYYPNLDLGLDEDREGVLIESPDRRFFQLGNNATEEGTIGLGDLKWEGKISVKAMSIIAPNPEIERQRKLELFNVISPVVYQMSLLMNQQVDPTTGQSFTPQGGLEVAMDLYNPVKQILEIQDEKPENWLPKRLIEMVDNPEMYQQVKQVQAEEAKAMEKEQNPLFIDAEQVGQENTQGGAPVASPMAQKGNQSVVAPSSIANPVRQTMGAMSGAETKATQW